MAIDVPQAAKMVCAQVEAMFGVRYTAHAMARVLGEMAFVFKTPTCVSAKADALIQPDSLDTVLSSLMASSGPDAPLSFVDGCHPSYTGRPAHGWIQRGTTVDLKLNHGRTQINMNFALSWLDRTLVHREERIASAAIIRLFSDLAARHPEAATVSVVLDNARYNRSQELRS